MKALILTSLILMSNAVVAENQPAAKLRYFRMSDCTSWSNLPGSYGMYGCNVFPTSVNVPDVNSLLSILNEQENLIKKLEARVQVLEQQN